MRRVAWRHGSSASAQADPRPAREPKADTPRARGGWGDPPAGRLGRRPLPTARLSRRPWQDTACHLYEGVAGLGAGRALQPADWPQEPDQDAQPEAPSGSGRQPCGRARQGRRSSGPAAGFRRDRAADADMERDDDPGASSGGGPTGGASATVSGGVGAWLARWAGVRRFGVAPSGP